MKTTICSNAYIQGKIALDETVLWQGAPNVEAYVRRDTRQNLMLFHAFMVLPFMVAFLFDRPRVTLVGFAVALVSYLFVAGLMYGISKAGPRFEYVVTSKRLLHYNPESDTERLDELPYENLEEIIVEENGTAGNASLGMLKFRDRNSRLTMQFDYQEDPYTLKETIEAAKTAWLNR